MPVYRMVKMALLAHARKHPVAQHPPIFRLAKRRLPQPIFHLCHIVLSYAK